MGKRRSQRGAAPAPRTSAQLKKAAITAYREYGTVYHACLAAEIGRRTWYDWKDADESFRADVEAAAADVADDLEREAIRRAKESSDTLLIFLLKGHKPDVFRERISQEVTGKDGAPLTFTLDLGTSLSDDGD